MTHGIDGFLKNVGCSNESIRMQAGKPFSRHQTIDQDFIEEKKIHSGAAMLKSVETRFVSQVLVSMTERVLNQKKVFKELAKDTLFLECKAAYGDPSRGICSCVQHFVILMCICSIDVSQIPLTCMSGSRHADTKDPDMHVRDQDILQTLACSHVGNPQGRTTVLFCIGIRA